MTPGPAQVGQPTGAGTGIGGASPDDEDPRADLTWGTIPNLVTQGSGLHAANEVLVDGDVVLDDDDDIIPYLDKKYGAQAQAS